MDYHPEGCKTPRSKLLRLFTVSHVCVWQWMGRRRRFDKPSDLIGSAGEMEGHGSKSTASDSSYCYQHTFSYTSLPVCAN